MVAEHHVVLKDVEHAAHLREDEDARAFGLHRGKELVKNDHLAGVVDDVLVGRVRRPRLSAIKKVRVVAALAELHDDIEQPGLALLLTAGTCRELEWWTGGQSASKTKRTFV